MSIHFQKRSTDHVGDVGRPRTSPRGGTLCVGLPKGERPTTSTSPTSDVVGRPRQRPTSTEVFWDELEGEINRVFGAPPIDTPGQLMGPSSLSGTRPTEWM